MAAAKAARRSDDERILKSATAHKMRRAEVKLMALLAGCTSVLLRSWAADATEATHAHASTKAEAAMSCE
jgi:hypothetical protein